MADYPDSSEVKKIRKWEFKEKTSFVDFMAYVKRCGAYWSEDLAWKQRGRTYWVSTGGWSGNEEIIGAMQDNFTFWAVCWHKSERGGHFKFVLPNPKTYFVSPSSLVIKEKT